MITPAEQLPHGSTLSADLAVVGAGPAGIVVAIEMADRGFDVLLIESGSRRIDARVQELSEAGGWGPGRHAATCNTIRRQLGGTSKLWGGRCVPYDPVDFDHRPYIGDLSWPVTYEQLLPYFDRACMWLQCGRPVFDVQQMPHLPPAMVPGLPNGDVSTATLERWSVPTEFWREYGGMLRRRARVQVVTGLTCTEVRSEPGGSRVGELTCRTLSGKHISVRARSYVLACGGLETTRLMLASRGPYGSALGDHSGHLGSWYMAHVDGVIANVRFRTPPHATIAGFERDIDGTHIRRRFSISREVQHRHELPNAIAYIANPNLADPRHGSGVLSLAHLVRRSPLARPATHDAQQAGALGGNSLTSATRGAGQPHIRPHLLNIMNDHRSVAQYLTALGKRKLLARGHRIPNLFTAYNPANQYPIQYHCEQIPNRQSRVSLTDKRDALGMPQLHIDLRFSKYDADGITRCHNIWDEYLRRSNCGRLEYLSDDPASAAWTSMGGGCHQLGTTRMAARAEHGVLDENLAVHGMRNLFVASSSAFPTSGQANPTFTLIVLAIRLSQRLQVILPGL